MGGRCAESLQRALAGALAGDERHDEADARLDGTLVENESSSLGLFSPMPPSHMRFLEHMLLDEHAAPDRGNDVRSALAGFVKFWGVGPDATGANADMPTIVKKSPDARPMYRDTDVETEMKSAPTRYNTLIPTEWGESGPYLIVAGPDGSPPHAVAFLVSVETQNDKSIVTCHYANTGAGATPCGERGGYVLVQRWDGDAIIPFVKLALELSFNFGTFESYVSGLKKVEGFVTRCIKWDGEVKDEHLILAQYAQNDGMVVSLPQRGGTCTYGCVLWLIGPTMRERAVAERMELEMKRRAIVYLATADHHLWYGTRFQDTEDRNVMRVMEATVATYAYYKALAPEIAALRTRIDVIFRDLYALMIAQSAVTVFYHVPEEVSTLKTVVPLDMGTDSFDSLAGASGWCASAMKWLGTRRSPSSLYCLFMHKARDVLCVRDLSAARGPEAREADANAAVMIAVYLALYGWKGGADASTAMGMLVRCARVAASGGRSSQPPDDDLWCLDMPESPFPWVVAETRALETELRACTYRNLDPDKCGVAGGAIVVGGVLVFERGRVSSAVWGGFWEYMQESAEVTAVLLLISMYTEEAGDDIRAKNLEFRVRISGEGSKLGFNSDYSTFVPAFDYLTFCDAHDAGFHAEDELYLDRTKVPETNTGRYMRLSKDDRVRAFGGVSAGEIDGKGEFAQMELRTRTSDSVAQRDDVELELWVEAEHAQWHDRNFDAVAAMAAHRPLGYCAGKYLCPMSRRRETSTANLDALLELRESELPRSADDGEISALLRAVGKGDVARLAAMLRRHESDPAWLGMHYAILKGHASKLLREQTLGAEVGGDVTYAADAPLTPYPLTRSAGASTRDVRVKEVNGVVLKTGVSVKAPDRKRRLAFGCSGGVRGTVVWALQLAHVPSLHWRYSTGRYEIHACGAAIRFRTGRDTTPTIEVEGREYRIDARPSEWSSLWYTTPYAAVFPVRDVRGALSLAVFMSTSAKLGAAQKGIWFEYEGNGSVDQWEGTRAVVAGHPRGEFFVVPLDAAGVMPACSHARARVLLLAYSRGSLCAARLMRVVAAGEIALTSMPLLRPSMARQFMKPSTAIFAAP